MGRPGILFIGAALLAVIALCFIWPQTMVAPGPVIPAHAAIAQDCFSCHAPLRGASAFGRRVDAVRLGDPGRAAAAIGDRR